MGSLYILLCIAITIAIIFFVYVYSNSNSKISSQRKTFLAAMNNLNSNCSQFYVVHKDISNLKFNRRYISIYEALFLEKTYKNLKLCSKYIEELSKAYNINKRILDSNIIHELNIIKIKIGNEIAVHRTHGKEFNEKQIPIITEIAFKVREISNSQNTKDKVLLKQLLMQANYLYAKAKCLDAFA